MNFEDERYVRVYTRDTTAWLMMPWQSRAILPLIFRKLDRAGLMELGEDGVEGLAVTISMPLEVVEAGLPELLRRGTLALHEGGLLGSPNFVAAQETSQSEKARAQAYRERTRDLKRAEMAGITVRDASVTVRDDAQRNVTDPSHVVTPRHTSSLCAVPPVPSVPPIPNQEEDQTLVGLLTESIAVEDSKRSSDVQEVFDHWVSGWKRVIRGARTPILDPKRRGKIKARLAEKFTVDDLKNAIDGLWSSAWHIENRKTDIELICRDAPHVEDFLARLAVSRGQRTEVLTPAEAAMIEQRTADLARETQQPLLPVRSTIVRPPITSNVIDLDDDQALASGDA